MVKNNSDKNEEMKRMTEGRKVGGGGRGDWRD